MTGEKGEPGVDGIPGSTGERGDPGLCGRGNRMTSIELFGNKPLVCSVVCYIMEHFILATLSAGLPGRGYPGLPGALGIKGWSPSIIYLCNPSVTEHTGFQWITFSSSSPQVTKAVRASLALQVIRVFPVSKVTGDFQVYRDAMVSQERGGSQAFL